MRALSAAELLSVWERGRTQTPPERAIALLEAASPGSQPAGLTPGTMNVRLLRLREAVFGPEVAALAECEGCGERVELGFRVGDLLDDDSEDHDGPGEIAVTAGGYRLTLRLPTGGDLTDAAGAAGGSVAVARRVLLGRCVTRAERGGEAVDVEGLPADVMAEASRALSGADPNAEVRLGLTCPACGRGWQEDFDILSFFWGEVQAWAARLLREVHELALAYGWREADILALSPWRRQAYLEMLAGSAT
jgi:hypothetical protein